MHQAAAALACLGMTALVTPSCAQGVPDAGSLLREQMRQLQPADKPPQRASDRDAAPPAPAVPNGIADVRVHVTAFKVTGARELSETEYQAVLAPWQGQTLGLADIRKAADALVAAYQRRDLLARVRIPAQDVTRGEVALEVIEGRIGSIVVETDGGRADATWLRGWLLARGPEGALIRPSALDLASGVINDLPGLDADLSLTPGASEGQSDVRLVVANRPMASTSLQMDNFGSSATGTGRLGLVARIDNPSGRGDQLTVAANGSEGSQYLRAQLTGAAGVSGTRLGVAASALSYRLLGSYAALAARGTAQTVDAFVSVPLIRARLARSTAVLTLGQRVYRDSGNGEATSDRRLTIGNLAVGGFSELPALPGGVIAWSTSVSVGHVDLSAQPALRLQDELGPNTAGDYVKGTLNVSLEARATSRTALRASWSAQLSDKNLDSSEKFSSGGPFGVRAFRAGDLTGDWGQLLNLEARHRLAPGLELTGFYDASRVRLHARRHTGSPAANVCGARGIGAGLSWVAAGGLTLQASAARGLNSNTCSGSRQPAASAAATNEVRGWISVSHGW